MHQLPPRTFLALLLISSSASAQIARPGRPASLRQVGLATADLPAVVLPRPDIERLRREDVERNDWPLRFGAVIPCAFSADDAGLWEELPSGELVWRLRLVSPGARSLGVLFSEYELPPGGELFLYDPSRTTLLGAFTHETRQPNGMLAVQPVPGDDLTIEYVQPPGVPPDVPPDVNVRPRLRIGEVVHDYRGILDELSSGSQAMVACLIDVNCPEGAGYQDIKRSVIMVLMGGGLCSAGMINNTANDGTPYFLTANHCGDMSNVVAVFGYENSTCGGGGASTSNTVSGATLLASSGIWDSQLYRLSASPPLSFQPFYAGWDRNQTQTGPAISISHPAGLPKKIAIDDQKPASTSTNYWVIWEQGKLEGGSSGSPLFNGSKRVIGPACCVTNFVCGNQWAYYGRFRNFWADAGLAPWLDPLGLGVVAIEGNDPLGGQAIPYNGSGANPVVYSSTTPPTVGTTWVATIDASVAPFSTSTVIVGHVGPRSGVFLTVGELLVNLATPRQFTSVATVSGGLSVHSNPIPDLASLIGVVSYSQGLVFSNSIAMILTNGIELRLK